MIDWVRIHDLHDEIGGDDFQEVVDLFLCEVAEALTGLDTIRAEPRLLSERLHFLKGSALNLGFSDMSRLCHAGEITAAAGHPHVVNLDDLQEVFASSRAAFLRDLPAQLAA